MIACSISFDSHVWTQKSDITRATYEHFNSLMRACKCLPELWHNFGIFFITPALSLKILFFKFHMIACSTSFDSHVWTQNSDITRATYEHLNSLMCACKCLPQLWHNFRIFFITRALSFKILFFKFHMTACSISFDSNVWTQKSDITRATLFSCVCLHELCHNFGILIITRPLSFKTLIFKFHMIACYISFDSHV